MPARVLVADDDALLRRLLRLALHSRPELEVIGEASDGAQALALACALEPDVVVLDLAMPELDGIEVAERVRPVLPDCAILIFSAADPETHAAKALAAGADRFLEKAAGVEAAAAAALSLVAATAG